jgi:GNAT superfamily N-acetyltransferase
MLQFKTVQSKADLKEFIEFPRRIYKNDPYWVPLLSTDISFTLTENPFWEHAEKQLFLAYDGAGKAVGRIAGIIDHNYVRFHDEPVGFFGFYESVNDPDVARALFDKVREWLKSKDVRVMRGPMNPSTNDESGFLCEGFGSAPRLMMPYNPPYYLDLAEKTGLIKAKELYAYDMAVSNGPIERLERLTAITYRKNPGLTVRKLNIRDFDNEIKRALTVYNAAWEKNWGFVPWTEKEFVTMARRLKDFLLLDTTLLAEVNGQPVGMLIAVPDYNFVMQKMDGKMFPTGIFKFLYYRSRIKALRLMIMGVVKEYRMKGIEGALYCESLKNSQRRGFKQCEFSWILDDNIMTQRAAEMMGGKLYKKYRIYEAIVQ